MVADFQNVNCCVFEQGIVIHKAAVQNIYSSYYFKTSSMRIFNAVKMQSDIGFIAHLHHLYIVVELHINFVFDTNFPEILCLAFNFT